MTMLLAVLSGFIMATIAPQLVRWIRPVAGWLFAILPAALFAYFASHLDVVRAGAPVHVVVPWVPSLGVDLAFYLDGLSLTFALLITGIGACVMAYAGGYLKDDPYLGRFYFALHAFMAAMLGVVLSENLFTLFIFWELTSFSSYLLIGYKHEKQGSRDAAIQALVITGMGGLAMLAGFIVLHAAVGTASITELLAGGDILRDHPWYHGILVLVLAGAFTKSAQFPFHFWLPGAMQAPTPVSAYLHSATMVKAGVYLLARMNPVLGGTPVWEITLTTFGAVTMLVGAIVSLMKTDLKLVLAGSTIMALGTLVMLIGIGTEAALLAAAVFLVVHSLYKGALFMVAGAIDHEAGTREIPLLGGLRKTMPLTWIAACVAAISMAGVPPLLGFVGKELIYEAMLEAPRMTLLLLFVTVVSNVFMVTVGALVAINPFAGAPGATPKKPHEAPAMMFVGPLLLAGLSLALGLATLPKDNFFAASFALPVAASLAGREVDAYVYLWHGINLAFVLSVVTVVSGLIVWKAWERVRPLAAALDPYIFAGCERGYQAWLSGLLRVAAWQFGHLQSGYLRRYLLFVFGTLVVLAAPLLMLRGLGDLAFEPIDGVLYFYELLLCVVIVLGAWGAMRAQRHLTAIILLGLVGYAIALLFVAFGAPDLAMTQFLVETLTVILVALVLIRLPGFRQRSSTVTRARDWVVAVSVGVVVTVLLLAITSTPLSMHLSEFFATRSVPEAYGRNVVNVILVDFRGVDTMGEITVLAAAAVGIIALLRLRAPRRRPEGRGDEGLASPGGTVDGTQGSPAVEGEDEAIVGPQAQEVRS